jgi:hypothetical protein
MVWRDRAAMRAFMRSGVHHRIMAQLPEWCDEAALVHWVQDASELPSWVPSQLHGVALDQNEGSYGFRVNYSDQTFTIE